MDCLSIYTSWHMDHLLWSMTPGADQTLLELGFHVNDQFEPEFIAALYEWHFIQTYQPISVPTSCISKQYVRFAILPFLIEQLGPKPWLPEEHVPWTVEAIRA
ncbi:hypothetical protein FRB93_007067 [Tulasnella sp. JGI-2019a]|nr:hypothetical protein FRB93_007067 [Tulasnella sp. JGI-2019a]